MTRLGTAAIVGGGVIGGGWAARFALSGWDVSVFDPDPRTEDMVLEATARARSSYPALYDTVLPKEGRVEIAQDTESTVANASWIQESVSENIELKRSVYDVIQRYSRPGTTIASSTSGFTPTDLQLGARRPNEIIVAHPFNPVYLLPLVEVVQSEANRSELVQSAMSTLRSIGMYPLKVRKEIDAHLADRFMEAVWREALWLVKDGFGTTSEIDDAIRMGFGLRWAQMGLFETFRIAGGRQGMEHFIQQFGPCLKLPWTRLMDVPDLDERLAKLIATQSDEQSGGHSIGELEAIRDENLVTILRGLKARKWGVGSFLQECEEIVTEASTSQASDCPMKTIDRIIPPDWVDYNGHMNEARYLEAFSLATDSFLAAVGCDQNYVATGNSYFTLETNIRHLQEAFAGDRIRVRTRCLFGHGKKLHLFHALEDMTGAMLATGEHLLVHIDLDARRSSMPSTSVAAAIQAAELAHAEGTLPDSIEPRLSFKR